MKSALTAILIICLVFGITGCRDQHIIENMTLSLIVGVDINPNNQLEVSVSSPVFNKEAKDKEEEFEVVTTTLRRSREAFDTKVLGSTETGKVQILLLGKKVMMNPNWFTLLDPFYRDPKSTISARVVMVDGDVSKVIFAAPKDKPRLPLYLVKMIDMAYQRNGTVKTSLQEFHRQHYEKGMTASITVITPELNNITILGAALLDEQGMYKLTIPPDEARMLNILKNPNKQESPFTLKIPDIPDKKGIVEINQLSFSTQKVDLKKKVHCDGERFSFDINMKMAIVMTERLFSYDMRNNMAKLAEYIGHELERQFKNFIRKTQQAHIDPVGFGMLARAYTYPAWLKVQDRWGEAFAKADIHVKVEVKILDMGQVK